MNSAVHGSPASKFCPTFFCRRSAHATTRRRPAPQPETLPHFCSKGAAAHFLENSCNPNRHSTLRHIIMIQLYTNGRIIKNHRV